jgi:trans-aconitate 3-methyltransferase
MAAPRSDPTFTNYTRSQAQTYFKNRLSYPQPLYETILKYHTSTGGQLDVLADIGCGPGRATRDLASAFDYAVGLDPGAEMIQAASGAGQFEEGGNATTRTGRSVAFAVCGAEKCAQGVTDALSASGSSSTKVDLLIAAMAVSIKSSFLSLLLLDCLLINLDQAHWFSMPEFWAEAARLVKSQGSVALWTCSSLYCRK